MKKHSWSSRLGASFIAVTFLINCLPVTALADTLVSVDVKANNADALTLSNGDSFTVSWISSNATSCQQTSPQNGGVENAGSSGPFAPGHPLYPAVGSSVTFTVACTDGINTASDSVTIQIPAPTTNNPGTSTSTATFPSVDVKANDVDGPVNLTNGAPFTLTWISSNATSCQQTSPQNSGVEAVGLSGPIASSSPLYPVVGGSVTFTIACTDGINTASDSVTINNTSASTTTPPVTGTNTVPSVDVKANGSDGPLTLTSGSPFTVSWISSNATSCQQTSPQNGGVENAGSSGPYTPSNPLYPVAGGSVSFTIACTDGINTASDSVTINIANGTSTGTTTLPTVDVKANGSDALTIHTGDQFTVTWISSNATFCEQTSPANSGVENVGSSGPYTSSHPWYPAVGSSTTFTIACTDGVNTASDSVTINAVSNNTGGGCSLPVFTDPTTASTVVGSDFSFTFSFASTSAANTSFDVATSSLPAGLTFSTSTNTITGTTTTAGTYTVHATATNPCGTTTQDVTITVTNPNGGGGCTTNCGGGGGCTTNCGGGSSSCISNCGGGSGGPVLSSGGGHGAPYNPAACLYLHDYMRIDFANDPQQVSLLQSFLKYNQGYDNVSVTGVFDQATFDAVSAFQNKYFGDILAPWGLTSPTGYVYILTLKKVNEIYCQSIFPLNESQEQEIIAYKALMDSLHSQGIYPELPGTTVGQGSNNSTTTPPVVGQGTDTSKGQNIKELAAAIFSVPKTLGAFFQCLWEFLFIIVVLYILASVLEDVLYSDTIENARKRFFTKWGAVSIGLVIAVIVAWILHEWCIILPLLVALLITLIIMALAPKHDDEIKEETPAVVVPPAPTTTVVAVPEKTEVQEVKTEKTEKTEAPKAKETKGSVTAFMTAPEVTTETKEVKTETKSEPKK